MSEDFKPAIAGYVQRLQEAIDRLDHNAVNLFIQTLLRARREKRRIFIMGNGGSAATASHFCCDFNKGASGEGFPRFRFICLNDNMPTLMAYANDQSYNDVFVEQLKNLFEPGDVVIGISGSGNSANVLKAMEYANANGGQTIGLCGYNGGKLKNVASMSIHIAVNDMQISEDLHMILDHLCMKVICANKETSSLSK